jgi:hypothetical protein
MREHGRRIWTKALRGMVWHFDGRVVHVCFFKVVTGEWNTEGVFFWLFFLWPCEGATPP